MEAETLEKLSKLLDRAEQDFTKVLEARDHISKHQLSEKIQKGLELYTIISAEFGNYCYLNGTANQRNIIKKISRGYNTLLNQMLKLLMTQYDKNCALVSKLQTIAEEPIGIALEKAFEQVTERDIDKNSKKVLECIFFSCVTSANNSNSLVKSQRSVVYSERPQAPKINKSFSTVLDHPSRYSEKFSSIPVVTSNEPLLKQRTTYDFIRQLQKPIVNQRLAESQVIPNRTGTYSRNSFESRADDQIYIDSLAQIDASQEHKENSDETSKAIEELLKRKEVFEKVSAAGSVNHLRQILKGLAKMKRSQGMLGSDDIIFEDEEDLDFDAMQDGLVRAYDGAQRKTATRVFKYVGKTQQTEKEQFLKNVKKNSVGTDPDHTILEAERQALLKTKDDEYQKLVYTRELENKTLRERVAELQTSLSNTIAENLEYKVRDAGDNVAQSKFEKKIRELANDNASLRDKIERKKQKIKSLKEDLQDFNFQSKGAGNQIDMLVTKNNIVMEENGTLKTKNIELKRKIVELREEIGKLEQMRVKKIELLEDVNFSTPIATETAKAQSNASPRFENHEEAADITPKNSSNFKVDATLVKSGASAMRKYAQIKQLKSDSDAQKLKSKQFLGGHRNQGQAQGNAAEQLKELYKPQRTTMKPEMEKSPEVLLNTATEKNGIIYQNSTNIQLEDPTNIDQDPRFFLKTDEVNSEQVTNKNQGLNYNINSQGHTVQHSEVQERSHEFEIDEELDDTGEDNEQYMTVSDVHEKDTYAITDDKQIQTKECIVLDLASEDITANTSAKINAFLKAANLTADHLYTYLNSQQLPQGPIANAYERSFAFGAASKDNLSPNLTGTNRSELSKTTNHIPKTYNFGNQFLPTTVNDPFNHSESKDYASSDLKANQRDIHQQFEPPSLGLSTLTPKNKQGSTLTNLSTEAAAIQSNPRGKPTSTKSRANQLMSKIIGGNNFAMTNSASRKSIRFDRNDTSSFIRNRKVMYSPTLHSLLEDSIENNSRRLNETSYTFKNESLIHSASEAKSLIHQFQLEADVVASSNNISSLKSELLSNEHPTDNQTSVRNRKILEWEQSFELSNKTKAEKQLEDVYSALQQKMAYNPKIKKIFKKFVMRNNSQLTEQDIEGGNFEVDFRTFKDYIENFRDTHRRCGENCPHLRRFYEKISALNTKFSKRPHMTMRITEVNKLPQINPKYPFQIDMIKHDKY